MTDFQRPAFLVLSTVLLAVPTVAPAQQIEDEAWLDAMEWRLIGPWRGGRARAVAGHPDDDQFYLMGATGGVFATHDAGDSWEPLGDDSYGTASVGAIEIAPSDINVIVVGMGESPVRGVSSSHGDGVYRSTDRGRTWTHLGLEGSGHPPLPAKDLDTHPSPPLPTHPSLPTPPCLNELQRTDSRPRSARTPHGAVHAVMGQC